MAHHVTKKKTVNNFVSKECAIRVRELFTGCAPGLNTLLTELHTLQTAEQQKMKSQAAAERVKDSFRAIAEGVKYGWHFGITSQPLKKHALKTRVACRRTRILIAMAGIAAFERARKQLKDIASRGHSPKIPVR